MIKQLLCAVCFLLTITCVSAQKADLAFAEISESLTSDQVSIFPNPAKDKIKISNNSLLDLQVSVYNILGDVVIKREIANVPVNVDISKLPSGIYIIAFSNGDQVTTQRLVKE